MKLFLSACYTSRISRSWMKKLKMQPGCLDLHSRPLHTKFLGSSLEWRLNCAVSAGALEYAAACGLSHLAESFLCHTRFRPIPAVTEAALRLSGRHPPGRDSHHTHTGLSSPGNTFPERRVLIHFLPRALFCALWSMRRSRRKFLPF